MLWLIFKENDLPLEKLRWPTLLKRPTMISQKKNEHRQPQLGAQAQQQRTLNKCSMLWLNEDLPEFSGESNLALLKQPKSPTYSWGQKCPTAFLLRLWQNTCLYSLFGQPPKLLKPNTKSPTIKLLGAEGPTAFIAVTWQTCLNLGCFLTATSS